MVATKISRFFASKLFFGIVIGLFTLSSLWIALGSIYPMAFDEEVHYGITQMYAESINPFDIHQTEAANKFGAVETDPSYLYYYLLSFPYRALHAVHNNQTFIVTGLRLINIALFVGALFLYRRLLVGIGLSKSLVHLVLAIVTLIPIVPLLAAHINYDNLVIMLVPLLLMSVLAVRKGLQQGALPPVATVVTVCLVLYGSVIKYAFLPIAAAAGVYLAVLLVAAWRSNSDLWKATFKAARALSLSVKIGLILALGLGMIFFGQRYGRNVVRYHSLVPDCGDVLTVEACREWGPWGRDYSYEHSKTGKEEIRSLPHYTVTNWATGMLRRLFFILGGPTIGYDTKEPLPIPKPTFAVLGLAGMVAIAIYSRTLFRRYPAYILFVLTAAFYIGALLMQEYGLYKQTAVPVAINGRYLVPFIPLIGAMGASALVLAARKAKIVSYLPYASVAVMLLFLQGGGVLTYIARSQPKWLYDSHTVQQTDWYLKDVVRPLVVGAGDSAPGPL